MLRATAALLGAEVLLALSDTRPTERTEAALARPAPRVVVAPLLQVLLPARGAPDVRDGVALLPRYGRPSVSYVKPVVHALAVVHLALPAIDLVLIKERAGAAEVVVPHDADVLATAVSDDVWHSLQNEPGCEGNSTST